MQPTVFQSYSVSHSKFYYVFIALSIYVFIRRNLKQSKSVPLYLISPNRFTLFSNSVFRNFFLYRIKNNVSKETLKRGFGGIPPTSILEKLKNISFSNSASVYTLAMLAILSFYSKKGQNLSGSDLDTLS